MADQLYFSRDTKVFILRNSLYYELPVLDGFSFSQAHNTSEITLSEAADASGVSRRARQVFNDSYAPTEWSFSTYLRPYIGAVGGTLGTLGRADAEALTPFHHGVEEILWEAFVDNTDDGTGITASTSEMIVNFDQSNRVTIGTFDLYFVLNWQATANSTMKVYKIADACINEASIDFDIDGIAMVNWSGFGGQLTDEVAATPYDADYAAATDLVYEGITATNNYIRNKLTTLDLVAVNPGSDTYSLVLTGGNITLSNNITYLTPETIGSVNQPLGHVTGTRTVGGNFTCYLDDEALSSAELFTDIAEATTEVTTNFGAIFSIGGGSAPKVVFDVLTAHLEIPTHNVDDVLGVEVNFHGIPSTIEGTNEVTITYTGVALA